MTKILLLGAGFTANFGTPVAKEVWTELFNFKQIQERKEIRKLLMKYAEEGDFESFYDEIINNEFGEDDQSIVTKSIEKIFKYIDEICKNHSLTINTIALLGFIQLFSASRLGKGFIFTLNQDLFLERLFKRYESQWNNMPLLYPGLIGQTFINNGLPIILPMKNQLSNLKNKSNFESGLNYIKLHGSYGWKNSNGSNQLIIGKRKSEHIKNEPLIDWYFKLFQDSLDSRVEILILGYGFSDKHINDEILKSIKKHNSSLIICDVKDFNKFKHELKGKFDINDYDLIIENIRGYFINLLKKAFPIVGNVSTTLQNMLTVSKNATPQLKQFLEILEIPDDYFETNPYY